MVRLWWMKWRRRPRSWTLAGVLCWLSFVVVGAGLGGCSSAFPTGAAASPTEHTPTVYVMMAPCNAYGKSEAKPEQSGKAKTGDREANATGDTSASAEASSDATVEADVLPTPSP